MGGLQTRPNSMHMILNRRFATVRCLACGMVLVSRRSETIASAAALRKRWSMEGFLI